MRGGGGEKKPDCQVLRNEDVEGLGVGAKGQEGTHTPFKRPAACMRGREALGS